LPKGHKLLIAPDEIRGQKKIVQMTNPAGVKQKALKLAKLITRHGAGLHG